MEEVKCQFQYYVLNYDVNARKVIHFNIFRNYLVNDETIKLVKKHLRNKKKFPFEEFAQELKHTIHWQEWARREYEIYVGDAFETDINKFEKWDCSMQADPNIEMIAREVIYQYKQWLKTTK